jgi:hypothetical protein
MQKHERERCHHESEIADADCGETDIENEHCEMECECECDPSRKEIEGEEAPRNDFKCAVQKHYHRWRDTEQIYRPQWHPRDPIHSIEKLRKTEPQKDGCETKAKYQDSPLIV